MGLTELKLETKPLVVGNYLEMCVNEGIMHVVFKPQLQIDLDTAKEIVKERLVFCAGNSYPIVANTSGIEEMTKEAREFLNSDAGREGVMAFGVIVDSTFSRFMANFFINVTAIRPKIPTKLFNEEEKALMWLKQFVN